MPDNSFRSETANLTWHEDGMPFSGRFQDVYYAKQDALGESKHVFLNGNRLAERWADTDSQEETFVIAELGFGAGLNFMLCWQLWSQNRQRPGSLQKLHYLAFERFPVSKSDLDRLHRQWPALEQQSAQLLESYRSDCKGLHRIWLGDDVVLDLVIGDAESALRERQDQDRKIDAWFLDGFTPDRNPGMWSATLFQLIAQHSHRHSTLATYSSAGSVRRSLQDAGFQVQRVAGFAGKRHMLIANGVETMPGDATRSECLACAPWFHLPSSPAIRKEAIVIGAGLAGCHAAYALAKRNWQVRVLEKEAELASGVNAIPQLALRCRLFNRRNIEAQIALQAYTYAIAVYQALQMQGDCGWYESGLWQFTDALNKRSPLRAESVTEVYPDSIVSAEDNFTLFDQHKSDLAYWFPDGGWTDPGLLCQQLLASENISLSLNCPVTAITQEDGGWQVSDGRDVFATAEVVIIANGSGLSRLVQTESLPLELTTGQCTLLAAQAPLDRLNTVVCGSKTVFPAYQGRQTVAASYRHADLAGSNGDSEDEINLDELTRMFPATDLVARVTGSRAALRINTRDRLPLVGPLADLPAMALQYGGLSRNARQQFDEPGHYHPGLYISAAHGSNGLATCALAGEYLASLANGDCLPLNRQLGEALNPCRFLIQDLKKQRKA